MSDRSFSHLIALDAGVAITLRPYKGLQDDSVMVAVCEEGDEGALLMTIPIQDLPDKLQVCMIVPSIGEEKPAKPATKTDAQAMDAIVQVVKDIEAAGDVLPTWEEIRKALKLRKGRMERLITALLDRGKLAVNTDGGVFVPING